MKQADKDGNPRIAFRVPEEHYEAIEKCARQRRKHVCDFAKDAVLDATAESLTPDRSLEMRLCKLEQACGEFANLAREQGRLLVELSGLVASSLASSALIRDDGTQGPAAGREKVEKHIRVAISAAGYVLETYRVRQPAAQAAQVVEG